MTGPSRRLMGLLPLAAGLFGVIAPAAGHIVLSQPRFEAGQNYAAFFKVEHGCGASPTVFLRAQIPQEVGVLRVPDKTAWKVTTEREGNRVVAVSWRGRLPSDQAEQFGLFVKLPDKPGTLYFPIVQQCEKGEQRWTEIPAAGQALRDLKFPAAQLQIVTPVPPTQYVVGDMMLLGLWSPATPGGAATAAAYMTIMNHGNQADIFLGGTSPNATRMEIHRNSVANGITSMRPAPGGVPIKAGETITLAPQGEFHVMLSGLKGPFVQGARVPVTLNFAKAGPISVELVVAPLGARAAPQGAQMTGQETR